MGVPGNANTLLLKSAAAGGAYEVSRSLRFSSPDSAYLSKNFGSSGNRKTWTLSFWWKNTVKSTGLPRPIFAGQAASPQKDYFTILTTNDNNTLYFSSRDGGADTFALVTTQVFRDPSAWYHIVLHADTTQATASNRLRLYVNGTQVTAFSTATYPSQNLDIAYINQSGASHFLGRYLDDSYCYLDSYLADIHFLDGIATDPSSFTDTDATTGQLVPKAYTGSYGTNGFRLAFDSYATTAALGTDTSGAGNTWTVNNFSVTAGSGNDSLVDTPTSYGTDTGAGGEVRGNYCTWNPLKKVSSATAVNGNLAFTVPADGGIASTFAVSSGKWYWEVVLSSGRTILGLATTSWDPAVYPGNTAQGWGYSAFNGNKIHNASSTSYGSSFTTSDVIGVAFDADAGTLTFYKNGTSQGQAFSGITGSVYQPALGGDGGTTGAGDANFGQRPFAYTAPSGFKALCDTNLGAPVVAKGSSAMDVKLYAGNSSTQNITGLNFSPDLVWLKCRSDSYSHRLFDQVRGATKVLYSNLTAVEDTISGVTAFNSDGFTLGSETGGNVSGQTFVSWCWDAGTSTVTNNSGTISSQVRANPAAGFSVVSWTAGSAPVTMGHGLGVAPQFIIMKSRTSGAVGWQVGHASLGWTKRLFFDTAASDTTIGAWNDTAPTSTVFTVGSTGYQTGNMIAYCWAPVSGYSSAFSYTGNGDSSGPFVYLGFRPRLILIKRSDSTGSWQLYDTARGTYNVVTATLAANESTAESGFASGYDIDILSSGFKVRTGPSNAVNTSGGTYIGYAWAESPFQYARAR